jgi:SAM-dependent methyltransferase
VREEHLRWLRCSVCHSDLYWSSIAEKVGQSVFNGEIRCERCESSFPVSNGIARFVARENYASGFGLEWTRHARTQYDSYSGVNASRDRFFGQTGWASNLKGEVILEAGSGSGRFTEQAANTGAFVISFDYSYAVEANYASNGGRDNVLIVQADIRCMPFVPASFDKVFCFGVLQHTPDPHASFLSLSRMLKAGGELVADIYKATLVRKLLGTKYYVRPFTRRLPPERLYKGVRRYIDFMWPLAGVIRRIPRFGYALNWRLLVADYSFLGLTGEMLKEWAYLDTFDMLAPRYDTPVRKTTFESWFLGAGLEKVAAEYTAHGVVARGTRPVSSPAVREVQGCCS